MTLLCILYKANLIMYDFDKIAHRYDRLNHLMTWGLDRKWRRKAVRELVVHNQKQLFLDVATGTGDVARELMLKAHPESLLTGIDLSEEMLAIARRKVSVRATLMLADAEQMPFENNHFDCVSVAFGVRNFVHLDCGLSEMFRVLKPGGKLVVLELSEPGDCSPIIKALYHFYAFRIIPLLGRVFAHNREAYKYLPESIQRFPKPNCFVQKLCDVGFQNVYFRRFTFGVCSMFVAIKPPMF